MRQISRGIADLRRFIQKSIAFVFQDSEVEKPVVFKDRAALDKWFTDKAVEISSQLDDEIAELLEATPEIEVDLDPAVAAVNEFVNYEQVNRVRDQIKTELDEYPASDLEKSAAIGRAKLAIARNMTRVKGGKDKYLDSLARDYYSVLKESVFMERMFRGAIARAGKAYNAMNGTQSDTAKPDDAPEASVPVNPQPNPPVNSGGAAAQPDTAKPEASVPVNDGDTAHAPIMVGESMASTIGKPKDDGGATAQPPTIVKPKPGTAKDDSPTTH